MNAATLVWIITLPTMLSLVLLILTFHYLRMRRQQRNVRDLLRSKSQRTEGGGDVEKDDDEDAERDENGPGSVV